MTMQEFLKEIDSHRDILSESAIEFLNELLEKNSTENILTETGRKILISMYTNKETYLNTFSSKQLGKLVLIKSYTKVFIAILCSLVYSILISSLSFKYFISLSDYIISHG